MVTDPEAIRFVNEQVRPMAEKVRAMKAELNGLMREWMGSDGTDGVTRHFPAASPTEPVEDGREGEVVSRLVVDDVRGLMVVLDSAKALLETAGYEARISKPCVRRLRAE